MSETVDSWIQLRSRHFNHESSGRKKKAFNNWYDDQSVVTANVVVPSKKVANKMLAVVEGSETGDNCERNAS